jgi:hypothetical protein
MSTENEHELLAASWASARTSDPAGCGDRAPARAGQRRAA